MVDTIQTIFYFSSFFFFFLLSRVSKIHLAKYIFDIIEFYFRDLISRNLGFKLFFRSLHLTAPNFFLWGCLEVKVYVDKQKIIQQPRENIRSKMQELMPNVLTKIMQNIIKIAQLCEAKMVGIYVS